MHVLKEFAAAQRMTCHPRRHLVSYMSGNQPMFRGHGQSDTDLFHQAVRREFQIAFEKGQAQFKENLTRKLTSLQWKGQ